MKKLIITFIVILIAFSVTACSTFENNNANADDFADAIIGPLTNIDGNMAEENEIDYTPYANLVNTYFDVCGEFVVEQHYVDGGANTAGFNYAELIDLDNDGILELVLAGVSNNMNAIESGSSAIDLYFDDTGTLKELVEIYTLSDNGEALLVSRHSFSSYGNGGVEFGIEYAKGTEKTYILNSFRSNDTTVTYYELSDGQLSESLRYDSIYDYENDEYSVTLNGQESDMTTVEDALALKGEVALNRISWLSPQQLEELVENNEETFLFLEQYAPINRPVA